MAQVAGVIFQLVHRWSRQCVRRQRFVVAAVDHLSGLDRPAGATYGASAGARARLAWPVEVLAESLVDCRSVRRQNDAPHLGELGRVAATGMACLQRQRALYPPTGSA
eukprot:COSAG02_NODE_44231_length_368_cov_0.572491_1_plen_107_part_01